MGFVIIHKMYVATFEEFHWNIVLSAKCGLNTVEWSKVLK